MTRRWSSTVSFPRRKRAEPPPKVTPEALAAFEKSSLRCELCRTKFLSRESYEQHVKDHGNTVNMKKVARLKENRYEP